MTKIVICFTDLDDDNDGIPDVKGKWLFRFFDNSN